MNGLIPNYSEVVKRPYVKPQQWELLMSNANQLALHLSGKIVEYCVAKGLPAGTKLTERRLGDEFGVSRSPIRGALAELQKRKIVTRDGAGYVLALGGSSLAKVAHDVPQPAASALYLQILRDRFSGKLPDHVSETDLLRQYGVTRSTLQKSLLKLNRNGYISRSVARGWTFGETLGSVASYQASYEFRLAIEPAALQSPNYRIDMAAVQTLYDRHVKLLGRGSEAINGMEWSALDAELHETIVAFSGNEFFIRSMKDQNQLRGIVEIESFYADERVKASFEEHMSILEALLRGDCQWAATLLDRHLRLAAESTQVFFAKESAVETNLVSKDKIMP